MNIAEQLDQGKEIVAIYLMPEVDGEWLTLTLKVCYVGDNGKMNFYDNYWCDKHKYQGLAYSALFPIHALTQNSTDRMKLTITGHHELTLNNAATYAKTLKTIDNKINRLRLNEGYPSTLSEEVMRFARAVGAKKLYLPRNGDLSNYDAKPIARLRGEVSDLLERLEKQKLDKAS